MQSIKIIKGAFVLFEDNTPIKVVSAEFVKKVPEDNKKKLINIEKFSFYLFYFFK